MQAISSSFESSSDVNIDVPILAELAIPVGTKRSWIFRGFDFFCGSVENILGVVSIVFCTAIIANIPILQFLSFGYLLEVSGRLARGDSVKSAMVGVSKAFKIGCVLLGTWLLLIPIRFFSDSFWYEASLIAPDSLQARLMRVLQLAFIVVTLAQIAGAWVCGGKLRYFFWPLFAPFSFAVWAFRKALGSRITRPILSFLFKWISPNLVNDLCNAQPPSDWFVPAILWKKLRSGKFYVEMRDGLWDFVFTLNLWHYFKLGFFGFLGTAIWLFMPTMLLIGATQLTGVGSLICSVLGVIVAVPVFVVLLFLQTHFARDGRFSSFFQPRLVLAVFRRAPLAHVAALLLTLVFALPLFFAKIEPIPTELMWTLSVLFVLFSWPSRIFVGLAYRRGIKKTSTGRWWMRLPQMALAIPIAGIFVVILSLTRYISWHGAFSMIENHVFLLPAPFWL